MILTMEETPKQILLNRKQCNTFLDADLCSERCPNQILKYRHQSDFCFYDDYTDEVHDPQCTAFQPVWHITLRSFSCHLQIPWQFWVSQNSDKLSYQQTSFVFFWCLFTSYLIMKCLYVLGIFSFCFLQGIKITSIFRVL